MSQCANTGEDEDKSGLTDLTEVLITQLFISFSWRECSLMGINGSIQRFSRLATIPKGLSTGLLSKLTSLSASNFAFPGP